MGQYKYGSVCWYVADKFQRSNG